MQPGNANLISLAQLRRCPDHPVIDWIIPDDRAWWIDSSAQAEEETLALIVDRAEAQPF